ncbi:4-hydroxy-3-methylbut-2-enyl diphosphate reductase [Entomospira entomophila]|uniref:4-hydroxy-3-methylbut-2-enyl diphosphate reductase n=1 Tax=Entomospira entomophila TaxID=2719988 RepID=A0A968KTS3_9SPIO|nr:4-hydroxy-3-methylbut-2-enyl diphosphate reductase [Entomospira entomophilus]NIZ40636.1 4-hydroxy-3-methylbut-2-enyl diphosphate reductase [Entomospira entomophilus]WDI34850.1 4-hydroxy-3-methylbut-2-enyl diphosphate reductase [Entomospira entomophilus]
MKTIIRADVMGYCMGVERAIKIAERELAENRKVISLGLLIHNEIENQRLENLGLEFQEVDTLPQAGNGQMLLIRAHGLDPQIQQNLHERGYHLVDATCPLVVMNQKDVVKARQAGLYTIIVGKPAHAEILAMKGFADAQRLTIISSEEEAQALDIDETEVFLLSQTTLRPDLLIRIKDILSKKYQLHEYRQSICPATQDRQRAVKELSQKVDVVVVVGDSHSANTRGLYESALEAGIPAYLVSQASALDLDQISSYGRIGITAGASVPDYVIDEVEDYLKKLLK